MERVGEILVETYRLTRLVASSGMAAVYEAAHLRVPKRFAVKFLRGSLTDQEEALERFRREAEIIAGLDHPNVVQLIDYNVSSDGVPYIILEFLDGETLGDRLKRGTLSVEETCGVVRGVSAALTAAHARGIIHRDLKPENIMICHNQAIKVLDFGVAKLKAAPELTAANVVLGTVGFMAPEQISGQPVDQRSDQFTLASLTYTMLCGRPAFELTDVPLLRQAFHIMHHVPPDLVEVSAAVNDVLRRGMAKAAAERFESVAAFADAFERTASGQLDDDGLAPLSGQATAISEPLDIGAAADQLASGSLEPSTDPHGIIIGSELNLRSAETAAILAQPVGASPNTWILPPSQVALEPGDTVAHDDRSDTPQSTSLPPDAAPLPEEATSTLPISLVRGQSEPPSGPVDLLALVPQATTTSPLEITGRQPLVEPAQARGRFSPAGWVVLLVALAGAVAGILKMASVGG
jgi:serine/threonine protein kinase